jgi:hypothetical protein
MSVVGCSRAGASERAGIGGGGGSSAAQNCGHCIDMCRLEMLTCAEDAACDAILRCSDTCTAGNRLCIDVCTATPNGDGNQSLEKLIGCVSGKCESDCGLRGSN